MKQEASKKQPKVKGDTRAKNGSGITTPPVEDNAAETVATQEKQPFYSPLKLVMIEKSAEWKKDVHAKMVSDGSLVSYPTILDMTHGVKKRYGKRTLKAVADFLQVPVERITP